MEIQENKHLVTDLAIEQEENKVEVNEKLEKKREID